MDGSAATRAEATNRSGPARPTLKLGTYNGTTLLETFLAKFENCSDYYGWGARECLCHLRVCLEDDAGQVLWDAGTTWSTYDVIALMRNRFGSVNQAERHRAQLRALRRQRVDSLQFVFQEVWRLMALAFPGQGNTLWKVHLPQHSRRPVAKGTRSVKGSTTLDEASLPHGSHQPVATGGRLRQPGRAERIVRAFVDAGRVPSSAGLGPAHRKTGDGAGRVRSRTEPLS